jgi:hypothetical protein
VIHFIVFCFTVSSLDDDAPLASTRECKFRPGGDLFAASG